MLLGLSLLSFRTLRVIVSLVAIAPGLIGGARAAPAPRPL
jgi:hypothetical protein